MTVRFRLVLVATLVLLAPSLASAQVWPSEMRRKFVDECLASCSANMKLTALQQAYADKKASPVLERYETLSSTCSRRVFR